MTKAQNWQPILYGRTLRADRWWRLRPSDRDVDLDWLNAAVLACADGGDGLAAGPRMLLARRRGTVLVGGAGRAALLSETMNSDGSRPLFCFAGWLSHDQNAKLPELTTLDENWVGWATELYAAWMPLDWDRHQADLAQPHQSPFCRAPWAQMPQPPPMPSRSPSSGAHTIRGITVVPASDRELCWSLLAQDSRDFAYAVSFDLTPQEFAGPLTHAALTTDASERWTAPEETHPTAPLKSPEPTHTTKPPTAPDHPRAAAPAVERTPPQAQQSPPRLPAEPTEGQGHRTRAEYSAHTKAGGWKNKVRGIRSAILGEPETPDEGDHRAPTPPEPRSGAAKDLDYWRRTETGRPAKRPDPGLAESPSEDSQ